MTYNSAVIRYGELALKGPIVRKSFESRLVYNISNCLKTSGIVHSVERSRGRIIVKTNQIEAACRAASKVFGVSSISPAVTVENDPDSIRKVAMDLAARRISAKTTFAVRTNRANRTFPLTSQEINSQVGDLIRRRTGGRVDLDNPDVTIGIDVRDKTYIFDKTTKGPGGLPLGTAGRVLSLFSGGIDSPVAAYLMMRRGCEAQHLYFDNSPFTGKDTRDRAIRVAKILRGYAWGSEMRLLIAPYGPVLTDIIDKCPRRLTCILCKRMMMRIAGEVSKTRGCEAIVNGSSLAQVCSQTMTNLALTISATTLPVFMPLLGFDKEDTVALAKDIGTYEASSAAATGCSAVPRHPHTHPDPSTIDKAESKLDLTSLMERTIQGISEVSL